MLSAPDVGYRRAGPARAWPFTYDGYYYVQYNHDNDNKCQSTDN